MGEGKSVKDAIDGKRVLLLKQANAKSLPIDGPSSPLREGGRDDSKSGADTVERELVSKAEEEDMEALLGSFVPSLYFRIRVFYMSRSAQLSSVARS